MSANRDHPDFTRDMRTTRTEGSCAHVHPCGYWYSLYLSRGARPVNILAQCHVGDPARTIARALAALS